MVESDGGRVFKVNAAYTSQRCHVCQADLDMSDYSSPVCHSCSITHHRDLNAAANVAQRVNLKKACETRNKHATKTKRVRRSKCQVKPLKHPGTKNKPTPKAPQNQKKNKTHTPTRSKEVSVRMCPQTIGFLRWTTWSGFRQQAARQFRRKTYPLILWIGFILRSSHTLTILFLVFLCGIVSALALTSRDIP